MLGPTGSAPTVEQVRHPHALIERRTRVGSTIFCSRLPDLVYQEIWAWLTVHYALTVLATKGAEAADIDPDRISFTRLLHITRRTATGTAGVSP